MAIVAGKREKENQNLRVEIERTKKKDGLWKEKILRQRHGYPGTLAKSVISKYVNNLKSKEI